MKKIFFLSMLFVFTLVLVSCQENKYEEEAGLYELYHMSGDLQLSNFVYYTIELKADGKAVVRSKGSHSGASEYEAGATFSIKDGKIILVSKMGSQKVTETYDYIDGEIHMLDVEAVGIAFTAKFRRAQD